MIAEVILNSNAKQLNRVFDYEIPQALVPRVNIGTRVFVPFSNRKQLEEGFVVKIKETSEYKVKQIANINLNENISKDYVELAKWMAKRYFCNISDCIKLMLPPGTTTKIIENRVKEKNANFVYLRKDIDEIEEDLEKNKIKSEKQIRALKFLEENDGVLVTDLEAFADVSKAVLKTLEKNEYIEIVEKQVDRNPFSNKHISLETPLKLNNQQQKAFDTIEESIDDNFNSEFLLYGVTGSRKNGSVFATNRKSFKKQ